MYLIKGIGEPPVSEAESTMFVLAMKYGYQMPMALLEVKLGTLVLQGHFFRNKKSEYELSLLSCTQHCDINPRKCPILFVKGLIESYYIFVNQNLIEIKVLLFY